MRFRACVVEVLLREFVNEEELELIESMRWRAWDQKCFRKAWNTPECWSKFIEIAVDCLIHVWDREEEPVPGSVVIEIIHDLSVNERRFNVYIVEGGK